MSRPFADILKALHNARPSVEADVIEALEALDARLRALEPCPQSPVWTTHHVWEAVDGTRACQSCGLKKAGV